MSKYLLLADYEDFVIDLIKDWTIYRESENLLNHFKNFYNEHNKLNPDLIVKIEATIEKFEDWYKIAIFKGDPVYITVPFYENGETETFKNIPYVYDDNGEKLLKNGKRISYIDDIPIELNHKDVSIIIRKDYFAELYSILNMFNSQIDIQKKYINVLEKILQPTDDRKQLGFDSKRTPQELKEIYLKLKDSGFIECNESDFINAFSYKPIDKNCIKILKKHNNNVNKRCLADILRFMLKHTDIDVFGAENRIKAENIFNSGINKQDKNENSYYYQDLVKIIN